MGFGQIRRAKTPFCARGLLRHFRFGGFRALPCYAPKTIQVEQLQHSKEQWKSVEGLSPWYAGAKALTTQSLCVAYYQSPYQKLCYASFKG